MNGKLCGAKTQAPAPSKRSPAPQGRCKLHRGAYSPARPPNWKHGRRSKHYAWVRPPSKWRYAQASDA